MDMKKKFILIIVYIFTATCYVVASKYSEKKVESNSAVYETDKYESCISKRIHTVKYVKGYVVDFHNSCNQKCEVFYKYLSSIDKNRKEDWRESAAVVPAGGDNNGNAAGPFGKIKIISVD